MKEIPIGHGLVTLIDDEDWSRIAGTNWLPMRAKRNLYVQGYVDGKHVLLHRFLMNAPADLVVDHRNHNGLDNQKVNLRICTHTQNVISRHKAKVGHSAFKGVQAHHGKWRARITVNGERFILGRFQTEIEAAEAYDRAAIQHFGAFAILNFST